MSSPAARITPTGPTYIRVAEPCVCVSTSIALLARVWLRVSAQQPHRPPIAHFRNIAWGATTAPLPLLSIRARKRKWISLALSGWSEPEAGKVSAVWVLSVGAERRAEKGHAVAFEDGCDLGAVGVSGAGGGSEFLEERVPTAGREHDDQLGRLVGQVEECVG